MSKIPDTAHEYLHHCSYWMRCHPLQRPPQVSAEALFSQEGYLPSHTIQPSRLLHRTAAQTRCPTHSNRPLSASPLQYPTTSLSLETNTSFRRPYTLLLVSSSIPQRWKLTDEGDHSHLQLLLWRHLQGPGQSQTGMVTLLPSSWKAHAEKNRSHIGYQSNGGWTRIVLSKKMR